MPRCGRTHRSVSADVPAMPDLIYDDAYIQVLHSPGTMPYALATFNNMNQIANGRDFWGRTMTAKHGIECFGFVTKGPNWFPATSMARAAAAIATDRPIINYGHSMGGYAALKYSRLMGVAGVVASAPQATIDPAADIEDRRYIGNYDAILNAGMGIIRGDTAGRVLLAYDPTFRPDRLHAEWVMRVTDRVEPCLLPYMQHRPVAALRPAVVLPLFDAILSGGPVRPIIREANRAKRAVPSYFIYLARALIVDRKPTVALRVLDRMVPTNDGERSQRDRYVALAGVMLKRMTVRGADGAVLER